MIRKQIEAFTIFSGFLLSTSRLLLKQRHFNDDNLSLGLYIPTSFVLAFLFFQLFWLEKKWIGKGMDERNGKAYVWETRNMSDPGFTTIPLFSLAVITGLSHIQVNYFYLLASVINGSLLLFTIILFELTSNQDSKPPLSTYLGMAASSSLTAAIILLLAGYSENLLMGVFLSLPTSLAYFYLLRALLDGSSRSFSIGEASTIAQAFAPVVTYSFCVLLQLVLQYCPGQISNCAQILESTQFIVVLSVSCWVFFTLTCGVKELGFYSILLTTGALAYLTLLTLLNIEPVLWIYRLLFKSGTSVILVSYWTVLLLLAVGIVGACNVLDVKITTTTRKYFHLLVVFVYVPGLFYEPTLLHIASCLIFAIFLVLEHIRLLNIQPFGPVIETGLRRFLDEKDSGHFILTHIYLLFGCSISFWIIPQYQGFRLEAYSGILALGIGDTAASAYGSKWGRTRWPDSRKTMEGTSAAVCFQTTASLLLLLIGNPSALASITNIVYIALATMLCCILEGVTEQVDNLTLPLFLYSMLAVL